MTNVYFIFNRARGVFQRARRRDIEGRRQLYIYENGRFVAVEREKGE